MNESMLREIADIHKAMSNHIRLAIMNILFTQNMSVNEIFKQISKKYSLGKMDLSNISKHLGVLKNTGIISCKGDGQKRIYTLKAKCLINAINCTLEGIKK